MEAGVSIVSDSAIDAQPITVQLTDQPVGDVLSVAARRVGAELTRRGNVYYLGTLRQSDVGVLVRRSPRVPPEQLRQAIDVLKSSIGRVMTYEGGLVVVGDQVEQLRTIAAMLDELERLPSVTWVVQLHVVEMSEQDARDLGLDVTPALDLAVTFGAASANLAGAAALTTAKAATLEGGLTAILRAAASSETMSVVADPLFVVADGSEATYKRGVNYTLPRRVVTQGGAVETSGYDTITAGFGATVNVREVGPERLRLKLQFTADELERFINERPVVRGETLNAEADLSSGGLYLLGSMRRERKQSKAETWLRWGRTREVETSLLQIYGRAYRIAGGLSEPEPAASGPSERPAKASEPGRREPVEAPKPVIRRDDERVQADVQPVPLAHVVGDAARGVGDPRAPSDGRRTIRSGRSGESGLPEDGPGDRS